MIKIVLASDNHRDRSVVEKIAMIVNDADYYWHLGDSEEADCDMIRPFISVKGNCDHDNSLPRERVFNIGNHRFILMHGHIYYDGSIAPLAQRAESESCDILLYGHTHVFSDEMINNIRCINPGSCRIPRDSDTPTYAVLTIDDNGMIKVEKRELTL